MILQPSCYIRDLTRNQRRLLIGTITVILFFIQEHLVLFTQDIKKFSPCSTTPSRIVGSDEAVLDLDSPSMKRVFEYSENNTSRPLHMPLPSSQDSWLLPNMVHPEITTQIPKVIRKLYFREYSCKLVGCASI